MVEPSEVVDSFVIDTSGARSPDAQLLCCLVLAPGTELAQVEPLLRQELRKQLSPRRVPEWLVALDGVPRTLNGKKCKVPVKIILTGIPPERAVSADALPNLDALKPFLGLVAS